MLKLDPPMAACMRSDWVMKALLSVAWSIDGLIA